MAQVEISEAASDLRELVERVRSGEDIVLIANGEALARMVPTMTAENSVRPPRTLGRLDGLYKIPEDFDAPLPDDLLDMFEGKA